MAHTWALLLVAVTLSTAEARAAIVVERSVLALGGGARSSASITVNGTLGQLAVGEVEGLVHAVRSGYWHREGSAGAVDEPGASAPSVFALYRPHPNPSAAVTVIPYDVARGGGQVALGVFDVAGREIRTLVRGGQAPGHYRVTWDGRADSGVRQGSGIYFLRLVAPGFQREAKIIRLR